MSATERSLAIGEEAIVNKNFEPKARKIGQKLCEAAEKGELRLVGPVRVLQHSDEEARQCITSAELVYMIAPSTPNYSNVEEATSSVNALAERITALLGESDEAYLAENYPEEATGRRKYPARMHTGWLSYREGPVNVADAEKSHAYFERAGRVVIALCLDEAMAKAMQAEYQSSHYAGPIVNLNSRNLLCLAAASPEGRKEIYGGLFHPAYHN